MASTTGEPVVVSRRIGARAGDIFRILADPGRHPDLDGSGMLRGGVSDAVISGVGPEQESAAWPVGIWPAWRLPDVRHILLHVITEVACHGGHVDADRELIDGTVWLGGNPYAGQDPVLRPD
ncbi:DUF664 domain-containing protein [Streptomyces sp. NPDC051569]|uniref:mycothiol transferase n=1 Tax=Streptomyces sp. NPDC051569 TaxID=3365661 RepID=UPI0037B460B0